MKDKNSILKENERLSAGDVVQHFKREFVSEEERKARMYLYQILTFAEHTETGEKYVVYRALYGENRVYIRPYEMFMSEVDKSAYPNSTATFRFEKFIE